MNTLKKTDYFAFGLAIFAMFFGAGNIIFPLALGQIALNNTFWGLSGFLLTAVAMPFMGLLAMFKFAGDIRLFFSRLGSRCGIVIASLIIFLLGPLGAAPRCLTLAYSTFSLSFPNTPLTLFSAVTCLLIFLFTYKETHLLKLLGYILSPLKITLLAVIMIKGLLESSDSALLSTETASLFHFWSGLAEGYNTMDLLAAFFFAPIVLSSLRNFEKNEKLNRFVLIASAIGALLLTLVYTGFCYLAYFYAQQLQGIPHEKLLGTIAINVLGTHAGLIVNLTVSFACLTTAIALTAAFVNFIKKELLKAKIGHTVVLIISLCMIFSVTTLEFQGIAHFLNPLLEILYPALIILTFYNLLMPINEKQAMQTNLLEGNLNDYL